MIVVKDLIKHFKSGSKVIKVVDGVSFELREGVLTSIIEKSGSGKTTEERLALSFNLTI